MLRDSQTQSFFLLAQAGGARKARILVPAGQDLNYSPSAETPIPKPQAPSLPAAPFGRTISPPLAVHWGRERGINREHPPPRPRSEK